MKKKAPYMLDGYIHNGERLMKDACGMWTPFLGELILKYLLRCEVRRLKIEKKKWEDKT